MNQVNQVNQSSPYTSSYRSEIDGLRAFAVLSVVAFHAFPSWLKGGFIGVDVFFVISGFLITSHIFEHLDKGQFSFTDFFGRRIRRIFPALILVMACSLAFGWFALLADEFAQLGKHVASGAAFITNFILVDESGYFDNAAETKPMLHLWSLAVEEQFYIVWPLVLWLAWKRKFNLLTITILVAVVSFYLNLRFVKSHPTETFFWPVGRFWELLSGSVLAWLFLYKSDVLSRLKLRVDRFLVRIIHSKEVDADGSTTSNLMSFFGLLLLAYGVIRINESLSFPSKWALIPVLGAVFIIASGSKAWLNRFFLMNPIAVWFGLISYPLYLWHWPILSFLQIVEGEMPHRDARIIAVLLSVFLAWVTYRFVERPIRFGARRGIKSIALLGLIAILGIIGFWINYNGGVTSNNIKLKYVSEAKDDWEYPKGLVDLRVDDFTIKSTSETAPPKVVFYGDSHAEQYSPRVVDLYNKGLAKEVAFITKGGCPSIPNIYEDKLKGCPTSNLKRLFGVIQKYNIETIIFSVKLNGYLSEDPSLGKGFTYYYNDGNLNISLPNKAAKTKVKESLFTLLTDLGEKHNVILLIDNPISDDFSPNSMLLDKNRKKRAIPIGSNANLQFNRDQNQIELAENLKSLFLNTNVIVEDPSTTIICPQDVCSSMDIIGRPIYKDKDHMRPFFVRDYVNLLDKYLLVSE
ncbi:TPA: acyltransferase [Vibrio cholerae]|uniref:acyltransferase family protein n=1 Tax=Vibrio cholerae TaxID=666 RepID=UPI000BA9C546|nr:acyltransferase [Vibrio cholerae]HDZ9254276.1 acyltransferase [Vibrio cholerae]